MRRYGMVNELPPAVRKKHQTVEQFEADRGHDEQIRGGNVRCMVALVEGSAPMAVAPTAQMGSTHGVTLPIAG
jgi:hypothetical protein